MDEQPTSPGDAVTEPPPTVPAPIAAAPIAAAPIAAAASQTVAPPLPPAPATPAPVAPQPPPPAVPPPPVYTWQQPTDEAGPAPGVRWGGYGGRLLAYIVDWILISVATLAVTFVLGILLALFANQGSDTAAGLTGLILVVVVLLIAFGYFPYFWSRSGQTPGMRMVRIRVVRDRDGGPISGGQAVLRLIGYFINSLVLYLGWIWIFIDGRRRGWHDLIAGTVVIEA